MRVPRLLYGLMAGLGLVAAPGVVQASTLAEGEACLERLDVECALEVARDLGGTESTNPRVLGLSARALFYDGQFSAARDAMARAVDAGYPDRWDSLSLYERTAEVTGDWTEASRGRYTLRYRPGVDVVLVESAFSTLEAADAYLAPLLGGPYPGEVQVEIYPDGRSFIAASSLTEKDVRTTGVVALSKWSRLLLTSPRALGRGYGWQDTLAHEYLHMIVSYRSDDQTPVWLQEAIAKYLDTRWRDGSDRFRLSPRQEALLGEALRTDSLVSFSDMHPSFAKLPSAELATLAYAQVSTLLAYAFERAGEDLLPGVLADIRAGTDAQQALATGAGAASFEELEAGWREWVAQLDLGGAKVAELPVVLDGGDAVESDPVLSSRADLARWLRIGDILAERGHHEAALIEYAKAQAGDEQGSPLLANRIAAAHLALGDVRSARAALIESVERFPEFTLTHKTLGEIHREEGRIAAAVDSYRQAVALNPYDPEVQQALAELYAFEGRSEDAARHERYVRILRRGGEG